MYFRFDTHDRMKNCFPPVSCGSLYIDILFNCHYYHYITHLCSSRMGLSRRRQSTVVCTCIQKAFHTPSSSRPLFLAQFNIIYISWTHSRGCEVVRRMALGCVCARSRSAVSGGRRSSGSSVSAFSSLDAAGWPWKTGDHWARERVKAAEWRRNEMEPHSSALSTCTLSFFHTFFFFLAFLFIYLFFFFGLGSV